MVLVKKPVMLGLASALALGAAYLGASAWIGQGVNKQVLAYEAQLIARDDVRVNRFDYQPGLLAGELHYDLVWQPAADSPIYAAFVELRPDGKGIALAGSLPIKQGPWLGLDASPLGFGLASTQYAIHLPNDLRPYLPQYPGQRPLVSLGLQVTLSGEIVITAQLIDYRGKLIDPDSAESALLAWEGGQARIRFSRELDQMTADANLGLLSFALEQESLTLGLENLHYAHDVSREAPFLWLGDARLTLGQVQVADDTERLVINQALMSATSSVNDNKLHTAMRFESGATEFVGIDQSVAVESVAVSLSLRDIDWPAYQDFTQHWQGQALEKLDETQLITLLQRLLAAGPSLHLDEARIKLTATEQMSATMSLGYQPRIALDWAAFSNLAEALEQNLVFSLGAGLTRPMLDRLAFSFWPFDAAESEIKTQLDATLAEMLAQNYVRQLGDDLLVDLAVSDGQVKINGKDFLPVGDAIALLDLASNLLGWAVADQSSAQAPGLAALNDLLNYRAPPLFEQLELAADFTPDPVKVPLQAGGSLDLSQPTQWQCLGYVNASRPDVTLNYRAGQFDLSIYVLGGLIDTTLVIRDPQGQWHCSDNYPGLALDPAVVFSQPLTGDYAIWVGLHSDSTADVELRFSELGVGE